MWLITGSVALKHWCPDFTRASPDIDVLCNVGCVSRKPSEFNVESQWHPVAEEIIKRNKSRMFVDLNNLSTCRRIMND